MSEMPGEKKNEVLLLVSLRDKGCRREHNLDITFEDAIDQGISYSL